jgi:hypothetical protein
MALAVSCSFASFMGGVGGGSKRAGGGAVLHASFPLQYMYACTPEKGGPAAVTALINCNALLGNLLESL